MSDLTPESVPLRYCTKCGTFLPATPEYFVRSKTIRGGFASGCKACRSEYRDKNANVYKAPSDPSLIPIKSCSKCHAQYPGTPDYFNRNRTRPDGLSLWCKPCDLPGSLKSNVGEKARAVKTRWRKKNPEYHKDYHQRHAEKIKQKVAEWQSRNREKVIGYKQKSYKANPISPEVRRAKKRAWRASNPAMARAQVIRRRAAKLNAPGNHTAADIERQYKAQKARCYYCHIKVGNDYHVDHVVPLSRGGSNDPSNIVIACPSCNTAKRDKMPYEWPKGNRLL